ncbi:hypothetical protein M3Y99_01871700 [Aphelenchoides fujianensis]|nr:hypothetical protein M3Y99_01871700 [Aphelenchoides fujianensis]
MATRRPRLRFNARKLVVRRFQEEGPSFRFILISRAFVSAYFKSKAEADPTEIGLSFRFGHAIFLFHEDGNFEQLEWPLASTFIRFVRPSRVKLRFYSEDDEFESPAVVCRVAQTIAGKWALRASLQLPQMLSASPSVQSIELFDAGRWIRFLFRILFDHLPDRISELRGFVDQWVHFKKRRPLDRLKVSCRNEFTRTFDLTNLLQTRATTLILEAPIQLEHLAAFDPFKENASLKSISVPLTLIDYDELPSEFHDHEQPAVFTNEECVRKQAEVFAARLPTIRTAFEKLRRLSPAVVVRLHDYETCIGNLELLFGHEENRPSFEFQFAQILHRVRKVLAMAKEAGIVVEEFRLSPCVQDVGGQLERPSNELIDAFVAVARREAVGFQPQLDANGRYSLVDGILLYKRAVDGSS